MSVNKSTKRGPFRLLHHPSDIHPYASNQFIDPINLAVCNEWVDVGSSPQLEIGTDGHQIFIAVVPKDADSCWDITTGTLLALRQNPMDLQKWDWWTFKIAGSGLPTANRLEWEVTGVEETTAA